MDDNRRRTLLALLHLAEESAPSACWDDKRAAALLQKEATPEELRALGTSESLISWIFSENHGG